MIYPDSPKLHLGLQNNFQIKDFAYETLGATGVTLFSLAVAASALGALNSVIFANASLVVSASRRGYFPRILGNDHCTGPAEEGTYLRRKLRALPDSAVWPVLAFARMTSPLRWDQDTPV